MITRQNITNYLNSDTINYAVESSRGVDVCNKYILPLFGELTINRLSKVSLSKNFKYVLIETTLENAHLEQSVNFWSKFKFETTFGYCYKIPDEFLDDILLMCSGKYRDVSIKAKLLIIKNNRSDISVADINNGKLCMELIPFMTNTKAQQLSRAVIGYHLGCDIIDSAESILLMKPVLNILD